MPVFPGGQTALVQYIASHLKYPTVAQENGIQGRVLVSFVVGEDGYVEDVQVIKGVEMMNAVLIKLYGYPYAEQRKERKGMRMTTLQGYSVPQEFYHIDYGRGALPDRRDFRRTLYWNPSVPVGTDGRAFVSFYNSNSPHRLSISAETLSSDGVPGMLVP